MPHPRLPRSRRGLALLAAAGLCVGTAVAVPVVASAADPQAGPAQAAPAAAGAAAARPLGALPTRARPAAVTPPAAGRALAAAVSPTATTVHAGDPDGAFSSVRVVGAPGVANRITVTRVESSAGVDVTDPAAGVAPADGTCTQLNAHTVRCPAVYWMTVAAGDGNDQVTTNSTNTSIDVDAGPGDDVVNEYGSAGTLDGGAGNDTVNGGPHPNTVLGGAGNDTLSGGAGDDRISGGAGNDVLYGDTGYDTLLGEAGDDDVHSGDGGTINDGPGNDTVHAGGAWTTVLAAPGADTVTATGYVRMEYRAYPAGVTVSLDGVANDGLPNEKDNIKPGVDVVLGTYAHDTLTGSAGPEELEGLTGNDKIYGLGGHDSLGLMTGTGTVDGGAGSDWCRPTVPLPGVTKVGCER